VETSLRHRERSAAIQGAYLKQRSPPEGAAAKADDLILDCFTAFAMTKRFIEAKATALKMQGFNH